MFGKSKNRIKFGLGPIFSKKNLFGKNGFLALESVRKLINVLKLVLYQTISPLNHKKNRIKIWTYTKPNTIFGFPKQGLKLDKS